MRSVLGDLSPATFLRDYWQKRPLLIRQAIPHFTGIVDRDELFALATRPEATSRLVIEHPRRRSRWERHDGPFGALDASMLPRSHWTLLIHGLESLVPGGWELLRDFSFIPTARIDDLMVSYAAEGGSVGPHDDRYDVFLLQGPGHRRWRLMHEGDRTADPKAAIRVLSHFVPDEEQVLEPGDMLYLPPGVAHWGTAESSPCFTYSIGFLAPSHQVLIESFLGYLAHSLPVADELLHYATRSPPKQSLALPDAMLAEVTSVLGRIRWDRRTIEDFLGRFLTSPRANATFAPPSRPLSATAFARRLRARGRLTLAWAARGLIRNRRIYLNGESHEVTSPTMRVFEELVTNRTLQLPCSLDDRTTALLHAWYLAGFVHLSR